MSARVLELLLADARTPSGGYAHSGGLEGLVWEGGDDVPAFMRARLRTVGHVDASFAAAASRTNSIERLLDLDSEWAARTPAEPLRRAARALGRGLLRTARVWFPDVDLLGAYAEASALSP
ncbi:MAG TPA: urease accessory UreF family protein, partial [Solirubrobacteraceae bacterium]|nr:urease accessory UreF family protein [Solirubrobacteraceae bacterium]